MPDNIRTPPKTASTAIEEGGAKLHAPSARRNVEPILAAIEPFMPLTGQALEIASGTGEHICRFAAAFPGVDWQPTDVEAPRLASIDSWAADAKLGNQKPARFLNAAEKGWAANWQGQSVVMFSNLLHLISDQEAKTVLEGVSQALLAGGVSIIYGPFKRDNRFASAADQNFHESLSSHDSDIGYKNLEDILQWQRDTGLVPEAKIDMPANNLLLVARKP